MRKSGILMHITSLPNPYGVGSMGKCAYEFVDFLSAAGQAYWQVLPHRLRRFPLSVLFHIRR